jgi:alkyldihydroxyacetonephosphate synthase
MVLGFESGDHSSDAWIARAIECCAEHGGTPEAAKAGDARQESGATHLFACPMRASF